MLYDSTFIEELPAFMFDDGQVLSVFEVEAVYQNIDELSIVPIAWPIAWRSKSRRHRERVRRADDDEVMIYLMMIRSHRSNFFSEDSQTHNLTAGIIDCFPSLPIICLLSSSCILYVSDPLAHVLRMGAGVFEKGGKEKEKGGVFVYQESLFHYSIC